MTNICVGILITSEEKDKETLNSYHYSMIDVF